MHVLEFIMQVMPANSLQHDTPLDGAANQIFESRLAIDIVMSFHVDHIGCPPLSSAPSRSVPSDGSSFAQPPGVLCVARPFDSLFS